jgi:glucoamylase
MALIIALPRPARLHWGLDGWQNVGDAETTDTGLALYSVELSAAALANAQVINFTFQWRDSEAWIFQDFAVTIAAPEPA